MKVKKLDTETNFQNLQICSASSSFGVKLNHDFGQRRKFKLAPRNCRVAKTMRDIQGRGRSRIGR